MSDFAENNNHKNTILDLQATKLINEIDSISKHLPASIVIHNIQTGGIIYMSASGLADLKISLEELQSMGNAYIEKFLNKKDTLNYLDKVLVLFKKKNINKSISFIQHIRPNVKAKWKKYYITTKILMLDDENNAYLSITTAQAINQKENFYIGNNVFSNKNESQDSKFAKYNALTNREKQLFKLLVEGSTSIDIALSLNISIKTVEQHRKNIRKKLKVKNIADLLKFAQSLM